MIFQPLPFRRMLCISREQLKIKYLGFSPKSLWAKARKRRINYFITALKDSAIKVVVLQPYNKIKWGEKITLPIA